MACFKQTQHGFEISKSRGSGLHGTVMRDCFMCLSHDDMVLNVSSEGPTEPFTFKGQECSSVLIDHLFSEMLNSLRLFFLA